MCLELAVQGADLALVDIDMCGCKYFLPHLLNPDQAHIVNMSSSAGLTGMKVQSSYAATKFAVRGLSECLCVELANRPTPSSS